MKNQKQKETYEKLETKRNICEIRNKKKQLESNKELETKKKQIKIRSI